VALEGLRDEDLPVLASLPLANQQRRLVVPQEAVPDPEGSGLRRPEAARAEERSCAVRQADQAVRDRPLRWRGATPRLGPRQRPEAIVAKPPLNHLWGNF
jgi:hypothetical protein